MNWIQSAKPKPGALHRQLHVPASQHIPESLLHKIQRAPVGTHVGDHVPVTPLLKKRVNFALNIRKK